MEARENVVVLGSGPFGRRVAEMMEKCHPGVRLHPGEDPRAAFDGTADAVVIASWRPAPALCENADRLAHRTGTPWLPVVDENPYLMVGPWVVPGAGPCFRCYALMRRHGAARDASTAPHRAHGNAPDRDSAGYLPHGARIAGGIALSRLQRPDRVTGRVTRVSLRDLSVSSDVVVPCRDCDRCGGAPGERGLRAVPRPATAEKGKSDRAR
ncbi:TOMM precursor leader peptide-binding protein [Streptomyces sp. NPDC048636]|uniref:TOMM precursor leader peptide-binding protein n=1 Tax=Streptomyces sp. NPDC048636 TaxID=3155762 RepID=UPI00341D4EAA